MHKLVQGLHKFRSEVFRSQRHLFRRLARGQRPEALFITCADSRINPNLITQTLPGDLFILRNAGNIVPPYGAGSGGEAATVELAMVQLGIQDIIVCGHTLCGAMHGMLEGTDVDKTPALKAWLVHAESTRRLVLDNYPGIEGDARLTIAVEENVLAQIENLRTHPSVRSRLARGDLALHGWVYKIETGEVLHYDARAGRFCAFVDTKPPSALPAGFLARRAI